MGIEKRRPQAESGFLITLNRVEKMGGSRDSPDGCTPMQRIFAQEYALCHNARQAIFKAYPKIKKGKIADTIANKNLKNPNIKAIIVRMEKEIHGSEEEVAAQARKVIDELAILSFADPRDYFTQEKNGTVKLKDLKDLGPAARAISSIEVESDTVGEVVIRTRSKYRFHSKTESLKLLGQHHKLYTELVAQFPPTRPEVYLRDNGMDRPVYVMFV